MNAALVVTPGSSAVRVRRGMKIKRMRFALVHKSVTKSKRRRTQERLAGLSGDGHDERYRVCGLPSSTDADFIADELWKSSERANR